MPDRNWDDELKKIDKALASLSDDQLLASPAPSAGRAPALPAGGAGQVPASAGRAPAAAPAGRSWPAMLRLALASALGVGMLFWPYASRCGPGLAAYLGATAAVVVAGGWSARWTWRHRTARAHVLSLLLVLWGLVLAALEVLPRIGYAVPTEAHPATWACLP